MGRVTKIYFIWMGLVEYSLNWFENLVILLLNEIPLSLSMGFVDFIKRKKIWEFGNVP